MPLKNIKEATKIKLIPKKNFEIIEIQNKRIGYLIDFTKMFRSEEMVLCQIFIQPEAAYGSVAALGETGCVQFRDLNSEISPYQRKFINEVRRCDELERQIRYIEMELKKDEIEILELADYNIPNAPNPKEIIDLEAHLERAENEILELSQNNVNLKSNYLESLEMYKVLEHTQDFFSSQEFSQFDSSRRASLISIDPRTQQRGRLAFIAGIISRERFFSFERMLWRISRGNVFLKRSDLEETFEDPTTGGFIQKTVFVVFFQGEELKSRVEKICSGFRASIFPCSASHTKRREMMTDIRIRMADLELILNQTDDHRNRVLCTISKNLPLWKIMVRKMKAIYHTLNFFNVDVSKKCLIGECWVPTQELPTVQKALTDGSTSVGSSIPSFLNIIDTDRIAPTYNRVNKFTNGFQILIEAYGIASYREANPAFYTIITFPFLFAVMFGDLGHGIILTLLASWMVIWEKKLTKSKGGEIWNIFFGGRYIILLMGLFSLYTGLIYNDIFSKSMNIFGSGWTIRYNISTVLTNATLQLHPGISHDHVYLIGMDPIWQGATNKIIFLNTYKMKMSIIIGIVHMVFGLCMNLVNFHHFNKKINIILEFIPQILFLLLLFGYMVFMMFFKWFKYSAKATEQVNTPGCSPSVLVMFINMMLFKHTKPLPGCKEYMFEDQNLIQIILLSLALICVPWMLLAKPLYLKYTQKGQEDNEIFMHQGIHTVEYVLSTISHTASYLRLWALSLAHAQLSEVLWQMVLSQTAFQLPLGYFGIFILLYTFPIWAFFTLAILILMEGLSAFLHTLRLHWVEFMSKFYEGNGYAFQPFSFAIILQDETEIE